MFDSRGDSIDPWGVDRRSPGYLPAVAWLDAVLDPGVSALHSSLTRSPLGLLLFEGDRHSPKIQYSRGYVSDSGLHPSPRHTRLSSFPACAFSHYATERLTNPYSGGPVRLRRIPSQQATIARLPQTVFSIHWHTFPWNNGIIYIDFNENRGKINKDSN
jgi:hypothetical protein